MFFLFGLTSRERMLFARNATCHFCGQYVAQRVLQRRTKLTVFFIPLLTVNRKRLMVCSNCGGSSKLSAGQQRAMAG